MVECLLPSVTSEYIFGLFDIPVVFRGWLYGKFYPASWEGTFQQDLVIMLISMKFSCLGYMKKNHPGQMEFCLNENTKTKWFFDSFTIMRIRKPIQANFWFFWNLLRTHSCEKNGRGIKDTKYWRKITVHMDK